MAARSVEDLIEERDMFGFNNTQGHRFLGIFGVPKCQWPSLYYDAILALAHGCLRSGMTFVEIGVGFGYLMEHLMDDDTLRGSKMKYFGIDACSEAASDSPHFNWEVVNILGLSWPTLQRILQAKAGYYRSQAFYNNFGGTADVRVLESMSIDPAWITAGDYSALTHAIPGPLAVGMVFIDGNHSAANVLHDMRLAFAWVCTLGGTIAIDDYGSSAHAGVKVGVDAFLADPATYSNGHTLTLSVQVAESGYPIHYIAVPAGCDSAPS